MTNDSKLKIALREEKDKFTKMMIETTEHADIIKLCLQSLQRIDDICKERNRY